VEDPVEIRRRIERVVARAARRDDYGWLRAAGELIRPVEEVGDVCTWRAEIRRHARDDRIKVRTGTQDDFVWALLHEGWTPAREEGRSASGS
jgi:hypothetical protein